ncbi:MAG: histidinolphosphatase [Alyxoria varia]|nr:MAG: histidinolphosphatase [Alyxoria varia]
MSVVALTEHVPRKDEHLYPSEREDGYVPAKLREMLDGFVEEAHRLRRQHEARRSHSNYPRETLQSEILIGFETEWIDGSEVAQVNELMSRKAPPLPLTTTSKDDNARSDGSQPPEPAFDFFVASVHHVRGHPIDFDQPSYDSARSECGGTDDHLFNAYFHDQHDMIRSLCPGRVHVIGHFDLIRLYSSSPDRDLREMQDTGVWQRVERNLQATMENGGVLEVNSSALRKGLKEPYPGLSVCERWKEMGGTFVLSDDSHGIAHVAAGYTEVLEFLKSFGVTELGFLSKRSGKVELKKMAMEEVERFPFWETLSPI